MAYYGYQITPSLRASVGAGTSFSAPTFNQLYYPGYGNPNLKPEHGRNKEAAVTWDNGHARTSLTWFDNRVRNPVSNVTRTDLVNTQQRQNLGRSRIWGLQTDADYRVGADWRVTAGYMSNRATVRESDATPELVGRYLPQVPKNRGSIGVAYANARYATVSVNALFFGHQFDDDRNERVKPGETSPGLPGYATMELFVLREVHRTVDLFFSVQNLFDEEYYVGLAPTTIGSPRLVNGGIRVRFSRR